jgi:homoserine O-acetyltransferase/O-succinyltransferase
MTEHRIFELGDFALERGSVLPDARIGYLTLGELNAARDNVVLCPTWFTGVPADAALVMTGPGRALDPERWFIVVPSHFGGGVSSSPSNMPPPFERGRFPRVTTYDNVRAQQRLLTEGLGVERIRLATSWSLGACQVYAWAAAYPDMVDAIAPIAGSARTGDYNKVFLAGNIAAIKGDPVWSEGFYDRPPVAGLRAMAAIYAGWGLSELFYRRQEYRLFGAKDVPEFIELFWEAFFLKCDANDLLAQMATWWHNDIADDARFAGSLEAALGAISARAIILPAELDRYFPPVDAEYEARHMTNAECRVIPSSWGHMAPLEPAAQQFIDAALQELLD